MTLSEVNTERIYKIAPIYLDQIIPNSVGT